MAGFTTAAIVGGAAALGGAALSSRSQKRAADSASRRAAEGSAAQIDLAERIFGAQSRFNRDVAQAQLDNQQSTAQTVLDAGREFAGARLNNNQAVTQEILGNNRALTLEQLALFDPYRQQGINATSALNQIVGLPAIGSVRAPQVGAVPTAQSPDLPGRTVLPEAPDLPAAPSINGQPAAASYSPRAAARGYYRSPEGLLGGGGRILGTPNVPAGITLASLGRQAPPGGEPRALPAPSSDLAAVSGPAAPTAAPVGQGVTLGPAPRAKDPQAEARAEFDPNDAFRNSLFYQAADINFADDVENINSSMSSNGTFFSGANALARERARQANFGNAVTQYTNQLTGLSGLGFSATGAQAGALDRLASNDSNTLTNFVGENNAALAGLGNQEVSVASGFGAGVGGVLGGLGQAQNLALSGLGNATSGAIGAQTTAEQQAALARGQANAGFASTLADLGGFGLGYGIRGFGSGGGGGAFSNLSTIPAAIY